MNQKNFEYLRDQVKYTGFGDNLENDLKENLQKQPQEFTLYHNAQYGNDQAAISLNFSKSNQSDMYFFNSYKVDLKKENTAENMEQTFYINKNNNLTLKEAYNLMSGRSVNKDLTNKEGQLYNAWVQMDFKQADERGNYKLKQYHQNYGYDLEKVLSSHPIKELAHASHKNDLMDSLKKGNRQSVTFQSEKGEQKHFIEANPQFKTLTIYDSGMQRMGNKKSMTEKESKGEKQSQQETKSEKKMAKVDDEAPDVPQAAAKKRRKKAQSL